MFWHNFKYSLRVMFRNKMMIFWTFAFPIILGTFFNLAFSNIEKSEKLDIIDIAVIENDYYLRNAHIKSALSLLSDTENEDKLFDIAYVDEDKAKALLEKGDITGYVKFETTPQIVINSNGINETVFKTAIEEILSVNSIYETAIKNNPNGLEDLASFYQHLHEKIQVSLAQEGIDIEDVSSKNMSYTMVEFYTLIAMTCLYGGTIGMYAINQNLADMSKKGKRVATSPTRKRTLIFSSVLASYVVQTIGLALLFVYTIFVLKVNYGSNLPLLIVLALAGCLAGLSLGIAVSASIKASEDTKMGIIISLTMAGCFLSGMMGITMKYIIDSHIPLLNKINPANMITDGLYALYYYTDNTRYFFNLISILIFSSLMILLSIRSLRRKKYDSI